MFQFIKNLLPRPVSQKLSCWFRQALQKHWAALDRQIPQYELQEQHFSHLKAVANREALLALLPKNGVVAELGVNEGDFSASILEMAGPAKLHLLDTWGLKPEEREKQRRVEQKFAAAITAGQVQLHVGRSTDIADHFEIGYFDWIYIDTDHSYATTKAELEKYAPKMKVGGIMAGHDFIVGNWNGSVKYGVIEAVYEFCILNDWEMIYLTMAQPEYPSFAIRRILVHSS